MFFKSKKLIGVDIGSSTIKVAEMDVSGNKATLVSFGSVPTPQGSLNSGEVANPEALASSIRGLVSEIKSKRKNICAGLWGAGVIVKKITIPRVEKKMIADQLRWEAEQYLPFDINTISLGYHVINPAGTNDTMDVLLIAAQHEIVNQYRNLASSAGLDLAVLDVSGFAVANIFELNYGKLEETVGILNIGSSVTNFLVLSRGETIFSRDVAVGGFNYTNEISKELGITLPEAESLKLSAGVGGSAPEEVTKIISTTNDLVTDEIRNSIEFFVGGNNGAGFARCFVTGGSSGVVGLSENIQQACSVTVESMNPFLKVKASKSFNANYLKQISPFCSVAMGLGIRKVGDS
jgi:type IV pilus assembly protein PilM